MKRISSLSLTVIMTLCLIVASERRAFAYVDPGSGLIALQTIASVGAAYAFVVRRKIRSLFTRSNASDTAKKTSLAVAVKVESREAA